MIRGGFDRELREPPSLKIGLIAAEVLWREFVLREILF